MIIEYEGSLFTGMRYSELFGLWPHSIPVFRVGTSRACASGVGFPVLVLLELVFPVLVPLVLVHPELVHLVLVLPVVVFPVLDPPVFEPINVKC